MKVGTLSQQGGRGGSLTDQSQMCPNLKKHDWKIAWNTLWSCKNVWIFWYASQLGLGGRDPSQLGQCPNSHYLLVLKASLIILRTFLFTMTIINDDLKLLEYDYWFLYNDFTNMCIEYSGTVTILHVDKQKDVGNSIQKGI